MEEIKKETINEAVEIEVKQPSEINVEIDQKIKELENIYKTKYEEALQEFQNKLNQNENLINKVEEIKEASNKKLYDLLTTEWKKLEVKKDIKEVIKDPNNVDFTNIKKSLLRIIDREGLSYNDYSAQAQHQEGEDYEIQFKIIDGIVTK